ncbi:hypothetical protein I7I51_08282 [Histoplasma capsulatum]|uniref:Uncharacterized protein n=2 Tax=Histoplasma TaxID=5036 RepID=A0A8A1M267_AJECA|nr:hypothetical protein I7I51_08282 [Histoplasma capsulatum]
MRIITYMRRRSAQAAVEHGAGKLVGGTNASGRADTYAFRDLLAMLYPHLKLLDQENPSADDREYQEKHTKLKN